MPQIARAYAPGRVNLIGEHTDYTEGWALPVAIDRGTTVTVERRSNRVELWSNVEPRPAVVALDGSYTSPPATGWARYVAAVVAELGLRVGAVGSVRTSLPIGAGLSSSASLSVAVALALGFDGSELDLARLCQRAEQRACGVPCGIMDQLASACGVDGAALLLDCRSLAVTAVPIPVGVELVAVHSGQTRALADSEYGHRRAECERAEREIGPLRDAGLDDVARIRDPLVRRRARHVVSENQRVLAMVAALRANDLGAVAPIMAESHASLRDDFEVSTVALDELVGRLQSTPGVLGARLTGAGFGGVAVAMVYAGSPVDGWRLRPSLGARRLDLVGPD